MPADARTAATPTVPCPHCGKAVPWDESSNWKPFCSARCRLIDLGGWLSEKHAIPGEIEPPPEQDSGD
ncbi:MAG: DNA gyrase inhibitor YacG [Gammaproteobacteria bacterium]|nr:DNA gyrase inhibitor YacG [Gammaproteobacteria bacterium]